MNKICISSIIRAIFIAMIITFALTVQSCKKYDPEKNYTVKFEEERLTKKTGLDTLKVTLSEGYNGKGKIIFNSTNSYAIEIITSGNDYVIINKKDLSAASAAVVATLLNDAHLNSSDTITYGNAEFKNKIMYEAPVGTYKDLFLLNPSTLAKKNLTNTPFVNEQYPAISGDGAYYAYVIDGSSSDTIYIVNTDNFSVFKKALVGTISSLKFSGDGDYLCYILNNRPKGMTVAGVDLNLSFKTNSTGYVESAHFTYANGAFITTTTYTIYGYYSGTNYYLSRNNSDIYQGGYYQLHSTCISSDGNKCFYSVGNSGYNSLYSTSSNGYSSKLVDSYPLDYIDKCDLDGTNKNIVFEAKDGYNTTDLYIYSPGSSYYSQNITNTPSIAETNPCWN